MTCGENLWQALQHLRSPDVERVIWVDAICIDQNNKFERTHQVSQMRDIYSHAVTVLIWLGPKTESSGIAMEWIEELSLRKQKSLGLQEQLSGFPTAQITNRQTQRWQALSELCRREYWRRVWIVQEVILARPIIIHCGGSKARWLGFTKLINGYDTIFTPGTALEAAQQVKQSLPAQLHDLRIMHKLKGCTLNKLLETTRDSLCTDPLDKVYALVGLAVECRNGESVADYSKSVDEMYNDLWNFHVTKGPSDSYVYKSEIIQRLFSNLQILPPVESCSIPYFTVEGQCAGEVIYVGQPWTNLLAAQEWMTVLNSHGHFPKQFEQQYQQFCRILQKLPSLDLGTADVLGEKNVLKVNRHVLQTPKLVAKSVVKAEMTVLKPEEKTFDSRHFFFWATETLGEGARYRRHCVFIAKNGRIGIAPVGARPGDEICQFRDCNTTALVRKNDFSSGFVRWNLVSKAVLPRRPNDGEASNNVLSTSTRAFECLKLQDAPMSKNNRKKRKISIFEDGDQVTSASDNNSVSLQLSETTLKWLTWETDIDNLDLKHPS